MEQSELMNDDQPYMIETSGCVVMPAAEARRNGRVVPRESAVIGSLWSRSRRALLCAAWAFPLVAWSKSMSGATVNLHITCDGDNMEFIPNRLNCKAGERVRLRFRHTGEIIDDPHNWVLLNPGTERAFLAYADREQGDDIVVPPGAAGMVIAATPMCPRGKSVEVTFVAPAPGNYPFVCSVPGHGETMNGTLTVNAS
jgi:uncharacterized cupredoxin-like copper-binding protein